MLFRILYFININETSTLSPQTDLALVLLTEDQITRGGAGGMEEEKQTLIMPFCSFSAHDEAVISPGQPEAVHVCSTVCANVW